MTTRETKKLIYGSLYGIICLGIFLAVFFSFFKPVQSCFDNIQNQNETGVDCGGVCAAACIPSTLQKITVAGDVSVFPSSPGHYTLLAKIQDTNSGFAAESLDYRFDLYDASGALVTSASGQSFMYASEVKYLVVPNVSVATDVDHATLTVTNPNWVPAATLGLVPRFGNGNPLPVTGGTISSSTITASGRIVNNDIATFSNILIVAVFRGANNTPLGASQTLVDRLAPNETQDFSVMYPAGPAIDPQLTQFYAYALRP